MDQQPAPSFDFNDALYQASYLVIRSPSIKSYAIQYMCLLMVIAFFIYLYMQKSISEQVSDYTKAGSTLPDDFFPTELLREEVMLRTIEAGSDARRACYNTFISRHMVNLPQAIQLEKEAVEECYRQHEKLVPYLFDNLYKGLFEKYLAPWNAHIKQTFVEFAFLTGANFFSSMVLRLGIPFVIYAAAIFLLIKLEVNRRNRGARTLQQNIQEMRQDFTRLIDNPVRSGALQEQILLDPVTGQPLRFPVVITLKNKTRITRDIVSLLAELNKNCSHLRINPKKSIHAGFVDFVACDLLTMAGRSNLQNNDQTEITRYPISVNLKVETPAILPWASLILAFYYYFSGFITWRTQNFILNTQEHHLREAIRSESLEKLCLGLDASSKSQNFIVSYFNVKEKTKGNFSFHRACTGYMSRLFLEVFDDALKKAEDAITAISEKYRSQFSPDPILFIVGALFLFLYVFLTNKQLTKDTPLLLGEALNNIAEELGIDKTAPRKHSNAAIEEQLNRLDTEVNEAVPTDIVTLFVFRYPIKVFFLDGNNYKRRDTTLEWATLRDCFATSETVPTASAGLIKPSTIVAIEHDRAMMEKIRNLIITLPPAIEVVVDAPASAALRHRRYP